MPDVSNLEPLQLRVHVSLLKLYAFAHPEACRQGGETVGPDPLLRRGAEQAESELVDRVAGARATVSGRPLRRPHRRQRRCFPRLREAFCRHHGEGVVVGVEDHHAPVYTGIPCTEALMSIISPGATPSSEG